MAFEITKAGYGKSVSNLEKIQKIPLDKIQRNKKNFYDTSKVEDLMDSIRMVGLLDPVRVVAMEGGEYRLISGHRRFSAYERLYIEALPEKTYAKIPALVLEDMDNLTESFALITANSTARELTYDEKLQQEQQLRETLIAMKEAGMEVPHNLGQYIADQIGVSRNEVSRMHSVNENLIPEAREKVKSGEMTAQQAYEMSRKPKEEQTSLYKSTFDANAYAAQLEQEAELLKDFVRDYGRRLAQTAAQGTVNYRNDGIGNMRCSLRNAGGNNLHFDYDFKNSGLYLRKCRESGQRTKYSWATVWDTLAIVCIEKIARLKSESAPKVVACVKWSKGDPVEDGAYAVRYLGNRHGTVSHKILFWYNGCWNLFNCTDGCPIHEGAEVVGWIHLPDADDENEEEVLC